MSHISNLHHSNDTNTPDWDGFYTESDIAYIDSISANHWAKIDALDAASNDERFSDDDRTVEELLDALWKEENAAFDEWAAENWITQKDLRDRHGFDKRLDEVLNAPDSDEDLVAQKKGAKLFKEMNANYAFVASKNKFFNFGIQQYIATEGLKNLLANKKYSQKRKLYDAWMQSQSRRSYQGTFFRPNALHQDGVYLNEWTGWALSPRTYTSRSEYETAFPVLVEPWLNHIKNTLCSGDERSYEYYIKWLAWMVQKTDEKPGVGVILYSTQEGAGKGILFQLISQFFGYHAIQISDGNHLHGNFTGHLADKIFVFLDEAVWGGNKESQGKMLSLVTEKNVTFEAKGVQAQQIASYHFFHIASNNSYAQHLSATDRRWFMPDVSSKISPKTKEGRAYFDKLGALLNDQEQKSAKAVLRHLLDIDLSNFDIKEIPKTRAKDRLVLTSTEQSDPVKAYLFECYKNRVGGQAAGSGCLVATPGSRVTSAMLKADFAVFKASRPLFKNNQADLFQSLNGIATACRTNSGRGWLFPEEDEFRRRLAKMLGIAEESLIELDE